MGCHLQYVITDHLPPDTCEHTPPSPQPDRRLVLYLRTSVGIEG